MVTAQMKTGLCSLLLTIHGVPPIAPHSVAPGLTVLASRNGKPVLVGNIPISRYPSNNFFDVWQASGTTWKDEFLNTPELVCLYRHLYSSRRDRESEAQLMTPAWCVERVLEAASEESKGDIEAKLRDTSFVLRCDVGDFVILGIRVPSDRLNRELVLPTVLQRNGDEYRVTFELLLNDTTQYLCSAVTSPIRGGEEDTVSQEQLAHLQRFVVSLSRPNSGEQYARSKITWDPRTKKQEDSSEREACLYVSVEANDRKLGYGLKVLDETTSDRAGGKNKGLPAFRSLVRAAWAGTCPDDHYPIWHSYYHDRIREWAAKVKASADEVSPPLGAFQGLRFVHGTVDRNAVLLASIDVGDGVLYYLYNGASTRLEPSKLVVVAEVQENNSPRLADGLGVLGERQGALSAMLCTEEFKAALLEYVRSLETKEVREHDVKDR